MMPDRKQDGHFTMERDIPGERDMWSTTQC